MTNPDNPTEQRQERAAILSRLLKAASEQEFSIYGGESLPGGGSITFVGETALVELLERGAILTQQLEERTQELEDLTVRLAYVNVWLQSIDGTGVEWESYMKDAIPALWKVLDGSDRLWLDEAQRKSLKLETLMEALRKITPEMTADAIRQSLYEVLTLYPEEKPVSD